MSARAKRKGKEKKRSSNPPLPPSGKKGHPAPSASNRLLDFPTSGLLNSLPPDGRRRTPQLPTSSPPPPSSSVPSLIPAPHVSEESPQKEEERELSLLEDQRYLSRVQAAKAGWDQKNKKQLEEDLKRREKSILEKSFESTLQVTGYIGKNWYQLFTPTDRTGWAFYMGMYRTQQSRKEKHSKKGGKLISPHLFSPGTPAMHAAVSSNILAWLGGFSVPRTQAPIHLSPPAAPYIESFDWGPQGTAVLRWICPPVRSHGPNVRGVTLIHYQITIGKGFTRKALAIPYPQEEFLFKELHLSPSTLKALDGLILKNLKKGGWKTPLQKGVDIPLREIPRGIFSVQLEFVMAEGKNVGAIAGQPSQVVSLIFPCQSTVK